MAELSQIHIANTNQTYNIKDSVARTHVDNKNIHVTELDREIWNNKSDFSGDYNDLTNKPNIPEQITESDISQMGFTKNTGTYSKPSTGIPESDLSEEVKIKLDKSTMTVDESLSKTSTNAIQNKAVANALDNLVEVKSGTEVDIPDMEDISNLQTQITNAQTQITELTSRLDALIDGDIISY